jgi:predicted transcriptional regulator
MLATVFFYFYFCDHMNTRKSAKVDPDLHRRLKVLAARTGHSLDKLMDHALLKFLQKNESKKLIRIDELELARL